MVLNKPEQLWVADITYLATRAGNTYLSLITDAYSRKIVAESVKLYTEQRPHTAPKYKTPGEVHQAFN